MANDWGDVELDAKGMRALAHPVRLSILQQLREHGPNTATGLSPRVGASPSVTSWHLRHLCEHGLVCDAPVLGSGRQRWWQAVGRGFRFSGEEDPAAFRQLIEALDVAEGDVVQQWQEKVAPQLEAEWLAAVGRASTRLVVTAQEAAQIEAAIEELLTPFVQRTGHPEQAPAGARGVRLLRYTMPEGTPS